MSERFDPFAGTKDSTKNNKTVNINGQVMPLTPELEKFLEPQKELENDATSRTPPPVIEEPKKEEVKPVVTERVYEREEGEYLVEVKEITKTMGSEMTVKEVIIGKRKNPKFVEKETPKSTSQPKAESPVKQEEKQEEVSQEEVKPVTETPKAKPVVSETPIVKKEKTEETSQKQEKPMEEVDLPGEEQKVEESATKVEPSKPETKQEEQFTPEQKEIADRNNISNYASVILGTNDELGEACKADFDEDPRSSKEKTEDPSDYLIAAARATRHGLQNQNQILQQRMLNALLESNTTLAEATKELRLARVSAASYLKKAQDGGLSGDMGSLAVIAATQGTYRLMLYNSGFHITMRPLTIEMANDFIETVDRDFENLGRIIGGFYHLPMSVFLKQKINEFLPQLIVASNLKNWRDRKTLLEAISYNDYETILWGLCTMLFTDGIGIGMVCPNKDCREHTVNEFIDLTKVCYLNLTKLNGEAVKWLLDTTTQRSLEDVKKYREEIIGNLKRFTPKDSPVTYVFKDPSLKTFVTYGLNLIGSLTDAINARTDVVLDDDSDDMKEKKEDDIQKEKQKQISLHLYKMLIPWIDHLEIRDKVSKEVITVTGYDAIAASLEVRNKYGENLYEQIEDFIRDSRCAFYCVDYLKCPRCGKMINYNKNEMTALDIEYIFFCLSCLILEQAGLGEE